jgi:hypothetical protein
MLRDPAPLLVAFALAAAFGGALLLAGVASSVRAGLWSVARLVSDGHEVNRE